MTAQPAPYRAPLVPNTPEARKEFETRTFALLRDQFGATLDERDQWGLTAVVKPEQLHAAVAFLRDEPSLRLDMLLDVTAVDYLNYPGHDQERFAVVYLFKSMVYAAHRLRLKVWLEEDHPHVPTITDLYKIADWQERETWDQYGIVFDGHHNLKRLLNHCEFEGHPLRKDYPAQRRQKLTANDPMIDQLEARLRLNGFTVLETLPSDSPAVEDIQLGGKK